MKRRTQYMLLFAGIVLLACLAWKSPVKAADIVIIVHNDVQIESLTREIISEIYLGTRTKWDNESNIKVVMLKKGDLHEAFTKDIVDTTPAKLKNFWKKVVFTGAGTPPKILRKEDDLVEYVAEKEGAIGYISSSTPHDGVKVIPLEDGK